MNETTENVVETAENVVETAENANESPENVIKTEENVPETLENETFQKGPEEKEEQEEIKTYYGSRKQYIDSLNTIKAALYIAASLSEMRSATYSTLTSPRHWEQWLMAEVDENGEEIQVVEG